MKFILIYDFLGFLSLLPFIIWCVLIAFSMSGLISHQPLYASLFYPFLSPFILLGCMTYFRRLKTEKLNNDNLHQIYTKLRKKLKIKNKKIDLELSKNIHRSEVRSKKKGKEYILKIKDGDRSLVLVHELTHIKIGHADIVKDCSKWHRLSNFYFDIFAFFNEIRYSSFLLKKKH